MEWFAGARDDIVSCRNWPSSTTGHYHVRLNLFYRAWILMMDHPLNNGFCYRVLYIAAAYGIYWSQRKSLCECITQKKKQMKKLASGLSKDLQYQIAAQITLV